MKDYKSLLDKSRIPAHLAIIMDGNGRWAEKRSLPRLAGHRMGAEVVDTLMDTSLELGIKAVSLYAFSTENWTRPKTEVEGLWEVLRWFFEAKIERIKQRGIQLRHSGDLHELPPATQATIIRGISETRKNKKMIVNFCLNYGGRQEIVEAVNKWASHRKAEERMTASKMERFLYTAGMPEVDLVIRTSGEMRISNFLLWQIAYAELVFVNVLWPDFKPHHLVRSIYEYQKRNRRFGSV